MYSLDFFSQLFSVNLCDGVGNHILLTVQLSCKESFLGFF